LAKNFTQPCPAFDTGECTFWLLGNFCKSRSANHGVMMRRATMQWVVLGKLGCRE